MILLGIHQGENNNLLVVENINRLRIKISISISVLANIETQFLLSQLGYVHHHHHQ